MLPFTELSIDHESAGTAVLIWWHGSLGLPGLLQLAPLPVSMQRILALLYYLRPGTDFQIFGGVDKQNQCSVKVSKSYKWTL